MNTTTLFNFMKRTAMVLLFTVTAHASAQTGNNYLVSHYEQDFVGGIGCAYVSGWVYDSSLKHWEAGNEIQVFGVISTKREETDEGYEQYKEYDNVYYFVRSDINEAYGLSGNHGFRIAFNLDPYVDWFNEEGASDGRTLWVRVYATVNNGNGYEDIELFGPIAVLNVKSPEWQETHLTQQINSELYTGFTTTDPTWKNLFDGDLSTYVSYNMNPQIEFTSDEVLIPVGLWFDTMYSLDHSFNPKHVKFYAKLHAEDEWTKLIDCDWSSSAIDVFDLTSFGITPENHGYRYFRVDLVRESWIFLKEIRLAAYCYKHLLPRLATCSQVGIIKECYQRDHDGKYFTDDAATSEYNASDVEVPIKAHEGDAVEGAGCWQCWMCHSYFSDEACTTPWPTWSVTLPEQMEIVNSTLQEDPDGKYIQGTVVTFRAKELYKDYISNVKVGDTELTPDQDGIYTLTVGDADAVVTATVGLLVLADKADNADAISAFSGQQVLVTLKDRTLYKDGLWNTLCLPFNMTAEQVENQLNHPTRLKTLASASFQDGSLTLNFTDATEIQAGKPYLIRWTKADGYVQDNPDTRDLKNPMFTGITIPDYSTTSIAQVYSEARCQNDYVDFIGTYAPLKFNSAETNILILSTASWSSFSVTTVGYPKEGATIGSGRGYFLLKGIHANEISQVKEFVLNTGEDDADGIEEMKNEELRMMNDKSWYDLGGRKLAGKPTQKGVYIVNGKKIIK